MRLIAILCSVFLYASPANANWNDHTFNSDIDYYKDTYLELNPDAVLTDWQWFPGSGESDGDLTNDQFCFPFANNGNPYIIIGANSPSTCEWWTNQTRYQGAEILSFFDLNLIAEPSIEYVAGETYTTEDLLGDTSQYWSGCFNVVASGQSWAGTSGGECPNINDGAGGQINYGYIQQTLTNIAAINEALKGAGLETTGYTYSWLVKNADANFESENNPNSVDPFTVTLRIVDNNNKVVFEKTYDYSYHIDNWQTFSGSEEFKDPFDLDELSEIQLSITGYDIGGWAGYYGPEFRSPDVRLNYRVRTEEDTTVEDLLFTQLCDLDPLSNMNCPGYNDAMLEQITGDITVEDLAVVEDPYVEDDFGIQEIVEVVEPIVEEQVVEMEVAAIEETPVEESILEETIAEASSPEKEERNSESSGSGLNANQLLALNIAENATNAAQSTAASAAQQSASVGLSESGGVSSELTSDGVSNADGTLNKDVFSNNLSSESSDQIIVELTDSDITDGAESDSTISDQLFASDTTNETTSVTSENLESTLDTSLSNDNLDDNMFGIGNIESNDLLSDSNIIDETSSESVIEFVNDDSSESLTESNFTGESFSFDDSINNIELNNDIEFFEIDTQQASSQENMGLEMTTEVTEDIEINTTNFNNNEFELASLDLSEPENLNSNNNIINDIINTVTNNIILEAAAVAEEIAEESSEESIEDQNAREDELVSQALSGSDDEDAQAALLGYNPNFRAYQQPQMADAQFYQPKDIYEGQTNYDNPSARLFNGASDEIHRQMVRQQYERN